MKNKLGFQPISSFLLIFVIVTAMGSSCSTATPKAVRGAKACKATPQPTPRPTPNPPPNMSQLPREGIILCDPKAGPSSTVAIWESPGLSYTTYEACMSEDHSDKGRRLSVLPRCAKVDVVGFAWSEFDQEFYLKIETPKLKGWVPENLIQILEPKSTSSPK